MSGAAVSIVGFDSSAGGTGAWKAMLPLLIPNSGIAFIVVQHLTPDYECVLALLLAKFARIPVVKIENQMLIEPDHIYVIPHNASVSIANDSSFRSTADVSTS